MLEMVVVTLYDSCQVHSSSTSRHGIHYELQRDMELKQVGGLNSQYAPTSQID